MKINYNLIIFLVVGGGMFLIGALLNGERINRKHDRDRIKRIEANQKRINFKIDSLYLTAINKEEDILLKIDSTYMLLDELYANKILTQKKYHSYKKKVQHQKTEISERIEELNRLNREFIFKSKSDK